MEAATAITCHLEEATILRDLRIGNLLDMTEDTIPGQSRQKDPHTHLQTLIVSNASDFVSLLLSSFVAHSCRIPQCNNPAFFDKRVNEFREWCSDKHMQFVVRIYLHNPVFSYLPLG